MKKHLLPGALSALVCPGLGQMVKGEILKGIGIFISLLIFLFASVVSAILFSVELGIVLLLCAAGIYAWSISDAYSGVGTRN